MGLRLVTTLPRSRPSRSRWGPRSLSTTIATRSKHNGESTRYLAKQVSDGQMRKYGGR